MTIRVLAGPAGSDVRSGESAARKVLRLVSRYGVSACGPIAVSGAHFAVSLIILRVMSRTDFGVFSFVLVIVPFCLSLSAALLGASMTSLGAEESRNPSIAATHFKVSLALAAAAALGVFALLLTIGARWGLALTLGFYAACMTMRWFARCYAYAMHNPVRAAVSDFAYSILLVAAVASLAATHELTVWRAAFALFAASALSLAIFGRAYLRRQFWPGLEGSLAEYGPIWRDVTRWSLMGVVLTEATVNAHAYLVTLISGPGAFALLALGGLMMRPVSLVFAALPDLERPAMARAIAAGDLPHAFRIVKEFRTAVVAIWFATIVLAGTVLIWLPHLVLKKGYDVKQSLVVVALYAAIMLFRALRTPEAVLLQAAREFRQLAHASLWSSVVSLIATLGLLLIAGPIASLGGVLAGELFVAGNVFALSRRWRLANG